MVLIGNKKGIFFTTLVILILSLFLLTYTFYSQVENRQSVQKRIETLNNFIHSTEENIPRQLRTSGFRVIFLFEKRIAETGSYITNLDSAFNEVLYNGTLYGETNSEMDALMAGAKLPDIILQLQNKAEKISADVNLENPSVSITQIDPWNIEITLTARITYEDRSNLAIWNKSTSIVSYIPLENLEDPLYVINTGGVATNIITRTPHTTFVSGNDISNLLDHSTNSYYIASTNAPSFLDRLEGTNAPNANGIESLVNLAQLSSQGISILDKSVVDHIYFSTTNPSNCNVEPAGMPSWFKLDNDHLDDYQVNCA